MFGIIGAHASAERLRAMRESNKGKVVKKKK